MDEKKEKIIIKNNINCYKEGYGKTEFLNA